MTLYVVIYDNGQATDQFFNIGAALAALKKADGKGYIDVTEIDLPEDCAF